MSNRVHSHWYIVFTFPLVAAAVHAGGSTYQILDLGTLGGTYSEAHQINDFGAIAGTATLANGKHAALWVHGAPVDLGNPPGGDTSVATASNLTGEIAAYAENSPQAYRAFRWKDGQWQALGTLPGTDDSRAWDINNGGLIVGDSFNVGSGPYRGFLWNDGVLTDLGTLGGDTTAFAINDAGQVVGRSEVGGAYTAFFWQDGAIRSLGTLPNRTHSQALAVNSRGVAVGSSWSLTVPYRFPVHRATLWQDDQIVDLGRLDPYTQSVANGINDCGQVVGAAMHVTHGAQAAWIWEDGVLTGLNGLIPQNAGWDLISANSINNNGQIVGVGIAPGGGDLHAFLLTPVFGSPCGSLPGDLNCDGAVDGADIEPFFLAIGFPLEYMTQFPACDFNNADLNGDGDVDGGDIDPFFDCLGGSGCP